MRALFLALGFGLTLVNFAFADETKPPSMMEAIKTLKADIDVCRAKATDAEKSSCRKDLVEKYKAKYKALRGQEGGADVTPNK